MPVNSFENYPMAWKPNRSELKKPYYLSIADRLERDILTGKLPENTKLPPQRELADFLDLNLSTITRAYKLCELKGLLYGVTGRGTFVSPSGAMGDTFLEKTGPMIEMGMIRPFYETNPLVLRTARLILEQDASVQHFSYSAPLGTERQIGMAVKWLAHLGIHARQESVLLCAGAQNALSVVLISLFQPGDRIGVDHFTYVNFKGLANLLHIQLVAIAMDEQGMRPDALEDLCNRIPLKGIYLMPTCGNPTSIFIPPLRRLEIAAVARKYGLLVIEDDIYSFLAPKGTKPLFHLLPEQTIHICSISKSISPGLRVAFLVFPDAYRERLVTGLLGINLKAVSLNGEIVAQLIETGEAARICRKKIQLAQQRNQIFDLIFPLRIPREIPSFFRWLPAPERLTSEELERLAQRKRVHVLGSHRFAVQNENKSSYVRVAISSPETQDDLKKGLFILRQIFEENSDELLSPTEKNN